MKGSSILTVTLVALAPLLIFASLFVLPSGIRWQAPAVWTKTFNTPSAKTWVTAISVDKTDLYAAGYTEPVDAFSTTSPNYVFLKKFDTGGSELWTKQIGNASESRVTALRVGVDGMYLSGSTTTTVFVEKYDFNGNLVWTNQFTNITIPEIPWEGSGLSVSSSGIYEGGLASGNGVESLILRDYNPNGTVLWTKKLATVAASGVVVYSTGDNVFVAGSKDFVSPLDDTGAFISEFDSSGMPVWNREFDNPPSFICACVPYGISSDTSGIYVAGSTTKALPPSNGFAAAFVRKYDWNGNVVWTSNLDDYVIYALGNWGNQSGVYGLGSGVVLRYDDNGNRVWTTPGQGGVKSISVGENAVYVGGSLVSTAHRDAFITSYSQSSSLVLFGVNPPISFVVLAVVVMAIALPILWKTPISRALKRHSLSDQRHGT